MLHAARRLAAAVPFAACLVVGLLAPSPALAQPDVAGTSAEGEPGTEVAIDFSWTQGGDAAAIQLDLTWDPAVLDLGTLSAGDALVDHSLDWSEVDTGRARVTVVTATPSPLGDGRLFTVPFTIAADAPAGAWPVAVESLLISSTDADSVDPREVTGGEVIVLASAAAPVEIPTLGTWSLALLTLLLLVVALHAVRGGAPLLVFVAVSLAALSLATPARAAVPAGDANGDGEVDSADIPVIVDQILERGTASGDPDCNGDSSVDVRDTICVATTAPPEPNEAPVLDAIADLGVREREIVGFVATATDPDLPDDELAWSLLEKPVGATIDPSSGSILWVPTGHQVGARSFRVRVTDAAGASDEETFIVDVRALGGPPILEEIADREVVESDLLSVTATATDPDLPDDALAFDLTLAPAGMGIDAASGEIAWTPGTVDVGLHDVTVRVTDQEGLIDFTSFVVDVREVNVAPVANDDVFEARLGVPLSVEAPGVLDNDSDANGDVLTSVLDSGPAEGDLELEPDGSFDYLLEPPDRTTPVELERVCETKTRLGGSNSNIAVGDVDADGVSEIVAAGRSGGTSFIGDVVILNPIDCTIELNTANSDVEAAGGVSNPTAVGLLDIDGDGDLEIIGTNGLAFRHLIAFHHDATLAWPGDGLSESSPLLAATPNNTSANHYKEAGPTFADLDGDGTVEIVMAFKDGTRWNRFSGLAVYDASDGSLVWEFLSTFRQGSAHTKPPTVVDLDLDGTMEVIVHNSVVDHNGVLEFELPSTPASGTWTPGDLVLGIANVDDDPFPELFGRDNHARYLFEHDGTLTRKENEKNSSLGQIAVADFDGDGAPEFSFLTCFDCGPGPQFLVVYDTDGSLLWSHEGQADFLHGGFNDADDWNPTAFDANRDGAMDLVIANHLQDTLFIFDGRDGSLLGDLDFDISGLGGPKFTAIADLDQDGDAEIVKRARHGCCFRRYEVWSGTAANPLPAAPTHRNQWIFQEAYNNPDGSIPTNPLPHWLQPGRNGWNLLTPEPDPLIGTTQTFTYHANDGALDSNEATVTLDVLPAGNPPRFLSDPDALTTRGFRYAYAPIVVDPDLGDVVTFHLTAGPDGMTIDPATGEVEWLPDTNGTYPVTILATDTIGFAVDQSWDLVVGDPVTVPDVVGLPQATAESQVTGASLLVGRTSEATHPSIPSGSVSAQTPVGGSVAEFGAEVDLVVSLGPAPEDVDDDGDGFTETGGDCNDNDAAIHPGAPDPPGDGIDQDCDGFDGSEPVAEVVVEPATLDLLAGESRQLKAWAVFADGTAQIATGLATWQSLNGTTATVTSTGRLTAVADTGPAQITATLDAIVGTTDVTVTDADGTDDDAPTVEITSPEDGESVFGPVDVLGTADDPNLVRYELLISPAGEESFTQIGGGTSPLAGGVLGELDPTLMLNGLYTLRLAVLDAGGNETMDEVTVQVDGHRKVGHFTISFTDLEIPLSGIPITVTRTYDSRDKRQGDFGVGWRLGVQTIELSCTNPLGEGWFVAKSGFSFGLLSTRSHRCSIDIPGERAEEFDFVPSVTSSPIVPFSFIGGSFRARPGTVGTLRTVDPIFLAIIDPQPGDVRLLNDSDLSLFAPQRFVYTAKDGTMIEFGPTGVERIEDSNSNSVTFVPGGILHSSGASVDFDRDALGRITEVTDPLGRTQAYSYSASGDLISHTDRAGNATRFFYDREHGLLRVDDPLGRPLARNEYDADGRLVAMTSAAGRRIELDHDLGGRQEVLRDDDGDQTVYFYDEVGNVVRVVDALGNTTQHTYDGNGNQTSTTNAEGETTTRVFDARDNLLSETDALGQTTAFTYDRNDNMTSVTDPRGHVTVFEYDSRNNRTKLVDPEGGIVTFAYDGSGNLTQQIDAEGSVELFAYDASGRQTARVDGRGHREEVRYDRNGNPIGATDRRGFAQTITFDARELTTATSNRLGQKDTFGYNVLGAIESFEDPLGEGPQVEIDGEGKTTAFVDALGNRTEWTYAADSTLTEVLDSRGNKVVYEYDAADRRTTTLLPNGANLRVTYDGIGRVTSRTDARGHTTSFEYDAAGRHVKTIDPLGNETIFAYDAAGNLVQQTDPRGNVFGFEYDRMNRRTRVDYPDGTFETRSYDLEGRVISKTDALGHTTRFEYDANGNLIQVEDALGGITTFAYDEEDQLILQTDANGHTSRFAYDAEGRQIERVAPDGSKFLQSYDSAGNVSTTTDAKGQTTVFEYDANDQVTTKQLADGTSREFAYSPTNRLSATTDMHGTTSYSYNSLDQLASVDKSDGAGIDYTYDLGGNLTSIVTQVSPVAPLRVVSYTYDALGRVETVTDGEGGVTTYRYDANGNQTDIEYPNGASSEFTFDSMNRLLEIVHRNGGGLLASESYILNALGDRVRMDRSDGSSVEYEYDALRRLTRETHRDGGASVLRDISFTYDAVGNRLTRTDHLNGSTIEYSYDEADKLLTAGSTTYTYDDNGSLTSEIEAGVSTTYRYDAEGRLAEVNTPTETLLYSYDHRGNRVRVENGSATMLYLVDTANPTGLSQVLEDYSTTSGSLASYVFGTDLVSQMRSGARSHVHIDGVGSVQFLTDSTGEVSDAYRYGAFGELLSTSGTTDNPYRFTGERFDAVTGFTYLRERYYSSDIGRFLTRDPFEGTIDRPVSLHRYLYANANPIAFTDPTGRESLASLTVTFVTVEDIRKSYNDYLFNVLKNTTTIASSVINIGGKARQIALDAIMAGVPVRDAVAVNRAGVKIGSKFDLVMELLNNSQRLIGQGFDKIRTSFVKDTKKFAITALLPKVKLQIRSLQWDFSAAFAALSVGDSLKASTFVPSIEGLDTLNNMVKGMVNALENASKGKDPSTEAVNAMRDFAFATFNK